jgi:putative ABC transport system permease protein
LHAIVEARRSPGEHDEGRRALGERGSSCGRGTLKEVEVYIDAVAQIVIGLMIGAIAACTNAFYSSFLGRMRELATLMAVGYTSVSVALMTFVEGMILTIVSGAVGIGAAFTLNGHTFRHEGLSLYYQAHVTPSVVAMSILVAVVIAVIGGAAVTIQTLRLNVVAALRS